MRVEMTNSVLMRQMEIQRSEQIAIPAVYPIVADKVNIASKKRVRIVEATSRTGNLIDIKT